MSVNAASRRQSIQIISSPADPAYAVFDPRTAPPSPFWTETSVMADVELQDDDRDTSLPSSALSPAEYRGFRGLVSQLDHVGANNQVSLYSVLEFLASFNGVTHSVAQKVLLGCVNYWG